MSISNRISFIEIPEKKNSVRRNDSVQSAPKPKIADFETAIEAAGCGKFHYLLFLSIIPVSWASSFDTANMSMILPSAECDLNLTLFHKGVLNAVVYVGMVLSGLLWGYLADVRGRKSILVYGYLADGICNVLAGFSQNFWTLVFFKFLSGFIISGPYASIMTYCSEFYATKDRARIPLLVGFSVAFGCIVNAALAWLVVPMNWSIVLWDGAFVYNSWRIFLSLCGVPSLVGVVCLCLFPESPRFLMSQGRNEDALKVFRTIYRINTGEPAENYPIKELEDERVMKLTVDLPVTSSDCQKVNKPRFQDGIRQMKPIFQRPHVLRLLLVVTMQFCGMLALNTIRLWQPQLFTILENFSPLDYNVTDQLTFCEILDYSTINSINETVSTVVEDISTCQKTVVADSVYVDTIIVSSATIFFIFVAGLFVNLLGHKNLLYIGYGVSLLCLVSMNWSVDALLTLVLACLFVGLMSTTLNIVIGAAVLLFPTSLRTMAVSLEMMVGRTGSIIGNLLFPVLLQYGCVAPIIALAIFTSICILLTCFIPKAKEKKIVQKPAVQMVQITQIDEIMEKKLSVKLEQQMTLDQDQTNL